MRINNKLFGILSGVLCICIAACSASIFAQAEELRRQPAQGDYIQWVDFNIPEAAMNKALKADIDSRQQAVHTDWITTLSLLGTTYWGEWNRYKEKDMDAILQRLQNGETPEMIAAGYEKYDYFHQVYQAVLGNMVGEYEIGQQTDANGEPIMEQHYGLRAYSPIAYGFSYSHYDDFGTSRSFGYRRKHLGNDLIAQVGTPIVAVESGTVTHCGWNKYGGWRIGIRSFDGLRYYYYAHCRKDHPFAPGIQEGATVVAGQPIGYVGMTGYSDTENVNGMTTPHLHFGMQLIFDPSQEEGEKEIWIDVYQIVNFLEHHKSALMREEGQTDYQRKYPFHDPSVPSGS